MERCHGDVLCVLPSPLDSPWIIVGGDPTVGCLCVNELIIKYTVRSIIQIYKMQYAASNWGANIFNCVTIIESAGSAEHQLKLVVINCLNQLPLRLYLQSLSGNYLHMSIMWLSLTRSVD